MAVSQVYTAIPNDVILATRWNNEFGNIYNNGTDIAFPVTKAVSFAGWTITLDASAATTINSTGAVGLNLAPGAKTGTPGSSGNGLNIAAFTFTDSDTAGSGTAAQWVAHAIQRPTLAASNTLVTTTDAATLYLAGAPIQGTNETLTNAYALWVDAGTVRLDGDLTVAGTETHTGTETHSGAVTFSGAVGFTSTVTGLTLDENPIINGAFDIWQRGATFTSPATALYLADRWKIDYVTAATVTVTRSTSVPTVGGTVPLFNYSLDVDVTASDVSIAAGDVMVIAQRIEGYNYRHFAQRAFTCSFWVYATKTGQHSVSFANSAGDRSYVANYTVNVTNTWEYKSVNVTASPTAGTWDYVNGIGVQVRFGLLSGSNFQTTAGAWQTGDFTGTSTDVNDLDSTSNFFRVTGVKLELGSVATPFKHRQFATELNLCKRYYQKTFPYATAPAQSAGVNGAIVVRSQVTAVIAFTAIWAFHTVMRAAPTLVTYNPSAANAEARNTVDNADDNTTSAFGDDSSAGYSTSSNAANSVNDVHRLHLTASIEL